MSSIVLALQPKTRRSKKGKKKKAYKELYEQINKNYQRLFDGSNMVLKLGEGCNLVLFSAPCLQYGITRGYADYVLMV